MCKKAKKLWISGLALSLALGTAGSAAPQSKSEVANPTFEHIHALTMDAAGKTLWIGAHAGLFRSEDRGKTWRPVRLSAKHGKLDVMSIAADVRNPQTIYVGTHEAGVFKTQNGGTTWVEANQGLGGVDIHGLAFDPNFKEKLHAAVRDGADGIYRTMKGGKNWTRVADLPPGEVKVIASVNISTGMGGIYLYMGTTEGLFRDAD